MENGRWKRRRWLMIHFQKFFILMLIYFLFINKFILWVKLIPLILVCKIVGCRQLFKYFAIEFSLLNIKVIGGNIWWKLINIIFVVASMVLIAGTESFVPILIYVEHHHLSQTYFLFQETNALLGFVFWESRVRYLVWWVFVQCM